MPPADDRENITGHHQATNNPIHHDDSDDDDEGATPSHLNPTRFDDDIGSSDDKPNYSQQTTTSATPYPLPNPTASRG